MDDEKARTHVILISKQYFAREESRWQDVPAVARTGSSKHGFGFSVRGGLGLDVGEAAKRSSQAALRMQRLDVPARPLPQLDYSPDERASWIAQTERVLKQLAWNLEMEAMNNREIHKKLAMEREVSAAAAALAAAQALTRRRCPVRVRPPAQDPDEDELDRMSLEELRAERKRFMREGWDGLGGFRNAVSAVNMANQLGRVAGVIAAVATPTSLFASS